jgi:hypothetical protein
VADARAHVQMLVLVVNIATVIEEYNIEKQRSVVRFCGQNDSMQRILIKKCFLFTVQVFVVCSRLGRETWQIFR